MEQIQNLIPPLLIPDAVPSLSDQLQMEAMLYNTRQGSLAGYDCKECKNKGYRANVRGEEMVMMECSCMRIRKTLRHIQESGLEGLLRECKFSTYETPELWQQKLKDAALSYVKSDIPGLFFGGQTGCGKTHLCTAIVGSLIGKGMSARYFVWREDSVILKGYVNDPEYTKLMQEYKQADVLYIDDLFKGGVSDADKKLAFELIDYRCRNKMKTLISTELDEEELIRTDEALAGRVFRMSKGFRLVIPKDRAKNYRLR